MPGRWARGLECDRSALIAGRARALVQRELPVELSIHETGDLGATTTAEDLVAGLAVGTDEDGHDLNHAKRSLIAGREHLRVSS